MKIIDQLACVDFLRGISPESRAELARICVPKRARKRQILFLEGQEAHSMYLLVQGAVQLYRGTNDGREVVIKTIQPGETFAEAILFEHERFPVSAVTLEPSVLLLLPRRQISCLLDDARFRDAFVAMLMQKMRYLSDRIVYLTAQDVEGRFRGFLESSYGRRESYTLPISKKDIAAAIGTNPETLSRLLARLRREGRLETRGRSLRARPGFWKTAE